MFQFILGCSSETTNNIIDIKSIFCSFGNSSYWTDLGKQKQDCKILYFPDRTNLDYNKPFKKFTNSAQKKVSDTLIRLSSYTS